jgi:hypothetical protein
MGKVVITISSLSKTERELVKNSWIIFRDKQFELDFDKLDAHIDTDIFHHFLKKQMSIVPSIKLWGVRSKDEAKFKVILDVIESLGEKFKGKTVSLDFPDNLVCFSRLADLVKSEFTFKRIVLALADFD